MALPRHEIDAVLKEAAAKLEADGVEQYPVVEPFSAFYLRPEDAQRAAYEIVARGKELGLHAEVMRDLRGNPDPVCGGKQNGVPGFFPSVVLLRSTDS